MSQRPEIIIVDAYNLLRALPEGVEPGVDLEFARTALEARLRRYLARRRGARLILVYDGRPVGQPTRPAEGALEIRFSRPPRKADDLVLELARKLEGSTDVTVVTSDMADIGNRLAGLRVRLSSSREFARRLEPAGDAAGEVRGGAEKPADVAPDEARSWVEEFGFQSFRTPDGRPREGHGRTPRAKNDRGSRP